MSALPSTQRVGFCKWLPSAEVSIIHNGNGDTPPEVYWEEPTGSKPLNHCVKTPHFRCRAVLKLLTFLQNNFNIFPVLVFRAPRVVVKIVLKSWKQLAQLMSSFIWRSDVLVSFYWEQYCWQRNFYFFVGSNYKRKIGCLAGQVRATWLNTQERVPLICLMLIKQLELLHLLFYWQWNQWIPV